MREEFKTVCKPWNGEHAKLHAVSVDTDEGSVLVLDPVAGHYTRHHRLSAKAVKKIVNEAKEKKS